VTFAQKFVKTVIKSGEWFAVRLKKVSLIRRKEFAAVFCLLFTI